MALFTPFALEAETLSLTPQAASDAGLAAWAQQFKLGTAGYRDLLDPDDLHNTDVPFNSMTLAIVLEARARLAVEEGLTSLHVGGEVRPHTQELIDLAARIYAAHGITVHLRPQEFKTTPIWLSSFGVFFEELDGGENFTASHSQSYKGGWKPMNAAGGQLLAMADRIGERARDLAGRALSEGLEIRLAAADDSLIRRDFDPVQAYTGSLRKVIPEALLDEIHRASSGSFRAAFCTEGGSMGVTARRVFSELGIAVGEGESVFFTHEPEDSNYHGIGLLEGVNHGVDPGKWQVYKHVGAQDVLREGRADVFFIWDPDGDRFNMITTAPAALATAAEAGGLEVDALDAERCLVFFKPNQIYFLLTALKISALNDAGSLGDGDWIVATTWPTSRSIGEMALRYNETRGGDLKTFKTPVGFKYFAALVGDLESQLSEGRDVTEATDVLGETTRFGPRPRLLIMAEESGGASMGPADPLTSRGGVRTSLAPKEKDAMQIGVMALAAAAKFHRTGSSFAEWYLDLVKENDIGYRFYERIDTTLFDESLQGPERDAARAAGNRRKEKTVAFFAGLQGRDPGDVHDRLVAKLPDETDVPQVLRAFNGGDGTVVDFEGQWFELRASGTDAVLRYYMEGRDAHRVSTLNEALTRIDIS